MVSIGTANTAETQATAPARRAIGGLSVAEELAAFLEGEALPAAGVDAVAFWSGFEQLVAQAAPRNRALLAERDRLQAAIDQWHAASGGAGDPAEYKRFLAELGYLLP